jgi:hypothetical protein
VIITATGNLERDGKTLPPFDFAGLKIKTPNDLVVRLAGVLIDAAIGNKGRLPRPSSGSPAT